jgi:hypothetical protein
MIASTIQRPLMPMMSVIAESSLMVTLLQRLLQPLDVAGLLAGELCARPQQGTQLLEILRRHEARVY